MGVDKFADDVYHNTSRQQTGQHTAALATGYRISGWEKEQKVLDRLIWMRYYIEADSRKNFWKFWQMKQDCSLKTKQCRINHATWLSQMFNRNFGFWKYIDWYEQHIQSAISFKQWLWVITDIVNQTNWEPYRRFNIIYWRVWSWLRTNAGGVLNTCKSNETIESLLLKVEWQTGE